MNEGKPSSPPAQLRALVPGITNRSLSLKLDDMEAHGLLRREVGADRSVAYSLTPRGRTFTRLSFPMVLHLSMDEGLGELLGAGGAGHDAVGGTS